MRQLVRERNFIPLRVDQNKHTLGLGQTKRGANVPLQIGAGRAAIETNGLDLALVHNGDLGLDGI